MLSETAGECELRHLADRVDARGGQMTVRELQRSSRRYPTAEAAEAALEALVGAGYGTWQAEGKQRLFVLRRRADSADTADSSREEGADTGSDRLTVPPENAGKTGENGATVGTVGASAGGHGGGVPAGVTGHVSAPSPDDLAERERERADIRAEGK